MRTKVWKKARRVLAAFMALAMILMNLSDITAYADDSTAETPTEWDFRSDDYTGQESYNGLTITGGAKHGSQYGMMIKNGSIVVPVSGSSEVIVSVGYNWDISFDDGTVSYFDNTNSGDKDVTYSYEGEAGTVTINVGSQCTSYIKAIKVVAKEEAAEIPTEWDFRGDDYTGQGSYNGLTITGGAKHGSQYGMMIKNGSIVVPVSGSSEVIVSVGYNWDISFDDGTVSYFDNTNSGDKDVTYSYEGEAGTVTINVGSQCTSYIKTIKVVAKEEVAEIPTEWIFTADDFTAGDYTNAGSYTYNGLKFTNGKSHNGTYLYSGAGTISVPVDGDCTVTVSACYEYSFYFEKETEKSVGVHTGTTSQIDSYSYRYKGEAGYVDVTVLGGSYINAIKVEPATEDAVIAPASESGKLDVWDLGAEQLDSTKYVNKLSEDIINGWFPDVEPGTEGVNLASFVIEDEEGNVAFSFNDGGYPATHRLRTTNTNLTRYDAKDKTFGGVTYNGFIYSNKAASNTVYIEMHAEAGDIFTFAVSSNGTEAEYVFEAPSGKTETQVYDAAEAGTLLTFYAAETGNYKLYTAKEKLVLLRAYVQHPETVTVSGNVTAPDSIPEGYAIAFTNNSTGVVTKAVVADGKYTADLFDSYTYTVSLIDANGYVVVSESSLELPYYNGTSKSFDVTIEAVDLVTITGSFVGVEEAVIDAMTIEFVSEEIYVPEIKIDGTSYTAQFQNGTEYDVVISGINDYQLVSPTSIKFTANGTQDFTIEKKPVYKVAINPVGASGEDLAEASFIFTNLKEEGYVYTFTGVSDIYLRDGVYSVVVENSGEFVQQLTSNLVVDGVAVSKTIEFSSDITEWNFSDSTFTGGKYATAGSYNYQGLEFTNGSNNKTYLLSGAGTISVPVSGDCKVVVNTCYQYSFYFEDETEASVNQKTGSTSQIDSFSYNYEGKEGYVDITVLGTTYITSISVVEVVPYAETITVGATGCDYKTINEALDAVAAMERTDEQRVTIAIQPGDYEEMLVIDVPNVTLKNASTTPSIETTNKGVDIDANAVRITSYYGHGYTYYSMGSDCKYDETILKVNKENGYASFVNPGSGTTNGSYWNATVVVNASGFEAEGIIFENSFNQYVSEKAANDVIVAQTSAKEGSVARADMKAGDTTVQNKAYVERAAALAIGTNVKEVSFDNCKFIGRQDTLYGGTGTTAAFYDCAIYGGTDYIFGGMTAVFAKCDLVFNTSEDKNDVGYITAAQTPANTRGLLMYNCTVTSTVPGVDTASEYTSKAGYLGRPWAANTGEAVFYNTIIEATDSHWYNDSASLINPAGWLSTLSGESVMSAEYGTYEMAAGVDNQSARVSWASTLTEPVLTDGTTISVEAFLGDWDAFAGKDMTIVTPDGKVDNTPVEDGPAVSISKYEFDATTLTAAADKEVIAEGTTFADGFFKVVGSVTKRTSSSTGKVTSIELAKSSTGAIQFTISDTADVELSMSSTGGSNTSVVALVDANGTVIANDEGITEVSTTAATTLTYTGLAAGTYQVVSPESSYNRGARLYSIVVEEASSVVTTEYEFDATTLTAAADKEVIAEGTSFADGFFKVVGTVTKRTSSSTGKVTSIELAKSSGGAIQFTVIGTADVELSMSSTGGSNTSVVALVDANGTVIANNEGITEVSTTTATTLTYTGLAAGTYQVVSPESSYNRGARLYSIVVEQTESGSRPARADWANVAAPEITSVALDSENANNIIVAVKGFIGYDGADSIVVKMLDTEGTVVNTASYASDSTECKLTFTPEASGKYTFAVELVRKDEEAKAGAETKEFDFTLPLVAPTITGAFNAGEGLVEVEWNAVKEATSYEVTVDGTDISYTTEELIQTIEGLTVGETYTIKVAAVRGEEKVSASTEITVSEEKEVKWYFAAYGSSTNTKNNGYEVLEDGSVRVYSTGGKGKIVPGSTDGLAYYYTTIDPDTTNFTLSATAVVNNWTLSNGQEGFGIMASDRAGEHGDATAFWNNAYMAIASKVEYYYDTAAGEVTDDSSAAKISMKLGVGSQEKVGVTAENLAAFDASDTATINEYFTTTTTTLESSCGANGAGTYNIVGNYTGVEPTGTVENTVTEFRFTIQKNNTGYFVSYTDENGVTTTQKYYDTEALSQIEKDSVCLGFFASRNADITFKDIEFTTIAPEDDAPAEERPVTLVTPSFAITSATVANKADYELSYVGNADGTLVIKNSAGKVLLKNEDVKANEKVTVDVKLALGNNTYKVTFTPDADYAPSEYEKLSSYDTVSFTHVVNYKVYGEAGTSLYVSPSGKASGNGTKENPLDIYTAVKYVQAGQTIVLMEGTYNLTSTVKVERGIDGTAQNMIYMVADPEAATRPVFDFGGRCAGMILAGDYWYFKGFDVTRSADAQKGIQVSGNNNVLDQINAYKNGNTGIQISRYLSTDLYEDWPANNLILNCTAYENADKGYEDADGFAAKLTVGDGNVFDGCVAHHNADDGWDLYAKVQSGSIGNVTIRNCVAYKNGWVLDENGNEVNAGNGNGFKMGGDSMPGAHVLENSVAFYNKAKGIDSNSGPDIKVFNCVSFDNGSYNVALYTNTAANTNYEVSGVVSFRSLGLTRSVVENVNEQIKPVGTQDLTKIYNATNFYWDTTTMTSSNTEGVKVSAEWFENTIFTEIERNADGTIDMNGFLTTTAVAKEEGGVVAGIVVTTSEDGTVSSGTASSDVTIGEETSGKIQSATKVQQTVETVVGTVTTIVNAESKEEVKEAISDLVSNITNIWKGNNSKTNTVVAETEEEIVEETVETEAPETEKVEIAEESTPLTSGEETATDVVTEAEAVEESDSSMLTIGAIAALLLSVCGLIIVKRKKATEEDK